MKCSDFEKLEMKYIDGSISPSELERLKAHIALCENCASEHEAYKRVLEGIAYLPEPEPNEGFTDTVMSAVDALPPLRSKKAGFISVCEAVCAVSAFMGLWNLTVLNGYRFADAPADTVLRDLIGLVFRLDNVLDTALYKAGEILGIYGDEPVFGVFTAAIIILGVYMQIADTGARALSTDNRRLL